MRVKRYHGNIPSGQPLIVTKQSCHMTILTPLAFYLSIFYQNVMIELHDVISIPFCAVSTLPSDMRTTCVFVSACVRARMRDRPTDRPSRGW